MDRLRTYFGGGFAALASIPLVWLLFTVSGAGSGVIPVPEQEPTATGQSDFGPSPFPLNPQINWTWFYAMLLATSVVSLLILAFLSYRRPRFGPDYHAPLEEDPLEKEFQHIIHLLGADPDPTRAIRLIFEAAETKIEHLPKRVAPETPFEWTSRVKSSQPHLGDPLDELSKCYAKTRFGPQLATTHERDTALQALRQLKHMSDNIVVPVSLVPVLPWA